MRVGIWNQNEHKPSTNSRSSRSFPWQTVQDKVHAATDDGARATAKQTITYYRHSGLALTILGYRSLNLSSSIREETIVENATILADLKIEQQSDLIL